MTQVENAHTGEMATIRIGDAIGFKDGIEQYGRVTSIQGQWISISITDGITGEKSIVQQRACDCWVEG